MPPTTTDDQVKFLISCIRYSNNGTIDFTGVATECSIVSKAAAAKRYERLLKANGIDRKDMTPKATPSPTKPKAAAKESAASKKRKTDSANDATDESDEKSAKSVYKKWEEEACPDNDEKIKVEKIDEGAGV